MNEREARKEGLCYTGYYERKYNSEGQLKLKEKAGAIRKAGFRAVMVQTDSGTTIYTDPSYQEAENKRQKWETAKNARDNNYKYFNDKISEYQAEIDKIKNTMNEYEEILFGPEPIKI
jgi:site-specific DNA-adenine methylase